MKIIATLALLACTSLTAVAQSTTTTETTTTATPTTEQTTTTTTYGSGTINEYTPGKTIIVKETSGPVSYNYGSSVTYVTKSGKALTEEQVKARIKVGIPVNVYYTSEGDSRVVSRVEVEDED